MTPEEYRISREEISRQREEQRRKRLEEFAATVNLAGNLELAELLLKMKDRIDELEARD